MGFPVRWCSSPSSWMISVPLAARFARMPGHAGLLHEGLDDLRREAVAGRRASPSLSTIPIISQWPVMVSFPCERSAIRPWNAAGNGSGGTPATAVTWPSPIRPSTGSESPPTARLVLPIVSEPTSPYSRASGMRAAAGAVGDEDDEAAAVHGEVVTSGRGTRRRRRSERSRSRWRRSPTRRCGRPRRGPSRARRPRSGRRPRPSRPPPRRPRRAAAPRPPRSRRRRRSRWRSSRRPPRRSARARGGRPSGRGRAATSRGSPSPARARRGPRRAGRRAPPRTSRRGAPAAAPRRRPRPPRRAPPRAPRPRGRRSPASPRGKSTTATMRTPLPASSRARLGHGLPADAHRDEAVRARLGAEPREVGRRGAGREEGVLEVRREVARRADGVGGDGRHRGAGYDQKTAESESGIETSMGSPSNPGKTIRRAAAERHAPRSVRSTSSSAMNAPVTAPLGWTVTTSVARRATRSVGVEPQRPRDAGVEGLAVRAHGPAPPPRRRGRSPRCRPRRPPARAPRRRPSSRGGRGAAGRRG